MIEVCEVFFPGSMCESNFCEQSVFQTEKMKIECTKTFLPYRIAKEGWHLTDRGTLNHDLLSLSLLRNFSGQQKLMAREFALQA